MKPAFPLSLMFVALAAAPALAAPDAADRSGSPYFVVPNADPGVDALPLKETRADIAIAGVMAHVRVTQVYKNEGQKPIEAIYVFPGSTRAAVFAMQMTVGERKIIAEIHKKDDARKIYEDAKTEGKTASLLEQQRPNVFQMSVANILPGDVIRVEMDYAELLVPEAGTYELVYPAVVGPRYVGEDSAPPSFTNTPYQHQGEKPSYGWDVAVRLSAGMNIKRVTSPSHPISTTLTEPGIADVTLTNKGAAGTRDFVLQYQLAGKAIDTGVLLFPGATDKDEGFFLAMVQPPEQVAAKDRPKREYVFIVDVSGSMHGFPIDTAKIVMNGLLDGMGPDDRFNILCFSGGNQVLAPQSLPTTPDNIATAKAFLASMRGGGGTEILGALREALAMKTPGEYARTFVAVTDGYVSVEPQVFRTIRENLGEANFFAFGIGSSVNRHLIEGMARMGLGEPFVVLHGDDAAEKAGKFKRYIDSPALTDIKVAFDGFGAYDVEPAAPPDLFASRPVLVFGKYKGAARGKITVTGTSGAGRFEKALDVGRFEPSAKNEALRYLWARHRIATLSDYQTYERGDDKVAEITQLGLDYHLMTAYTSFVAVDHRVRNQGGDSTTVKQPLPLPDGVSDLAVGDMGARTGGYAPAPTSAPPRKMAKGGYALEVAKPVSQTADKEDEEAEPADAPTLVPPVTPASKVRVTAVQVVSGPRALADVEAAVRKLEPQLLRCVSSEGAAAGKTVTVELVIGKDGAVKTSRLVTNPTGDALGRCLTRPFSLARFAAVPEGQVGDTVVRVTLTLTA